MLLNKTRYFPSYLALLLWLSRASCRRLLFSLHCCSFLAPVFSPRGWRPPTVSSMFWLGCSLLGVHCLGALLTPLMKIGPPAAQVLLPCITLWFFLPLPFISTLFTLLFILALISASKFDFNLPILRLCRNLSLNFPPDLSSKVRWLFHWNWDCRFFLLKKNDRVWSRIIQSPFCV